MKQTLATFPIQSLAGQSGSGFKVRYAADSQFRALTGELYLAGDSTRHYFDITLTNNGGVWTFPTTEFDTTDDSTDPNATYTAWVVNSSDKQLYTLFERWTFRASLGTTITWTDLETSNVVRVPLRDDTAYSKVQTDLRIASALNVGNPATTSAIGRVKASASPTDPVSPTAYVVGDTSVVLTTDPRLGYVTPQQYGALGDNTGATITAGDVAAHTLGMGYPWRGTYTVGVDTKDYVGLQEAIYAAYYTGLTANGTNSGLNKKLFIPGGNYHLNKSLRMTAVRGAVMQGAGNLTSNLISVFAGPALIADGLWYSSFSDIQFKGTVAHSGGVVEMDGNRSGSTLSLQYVTFTNCLFHGGDVAYWGASVNAYAGGSGQGDGLMFVNCRFHHAAEIGLYLNGANTLSINVLGGDLQGNPQYGIYIGFQATAFINGPTMENGVNTADVFITGAASAQSEVRNIRSESKVGVLSNAATGPVVVSNYGIGSGWISASGGTLSTWAASTAYTTSRYVVGNGRIFKVTTAGTTDLTIPDWDSVASGGTVADGTVTWTEQTYTSMTVKKGVIRDSAILYGRVDIGVTTGNAVGVEDTVVTRTDWLVGDANYGGWVDSASTKTTANVKNVQVKKIPDAGTVWPQVASTAWGNRSQSTWPSATKALQPSVVNPQFMGYGGYFVSRGAGSGLGAADVGFTHGGPDSNTSGMSGHGGLTDAYISLNQLGFYGTLGAGKIPSGTDQPGIDTSIQATPGTGAGTPGTGYLRAAAAGSTGATPQTTANVFSWSSTAVTAIGVPFKPAKTATLSTSATVDIGAALATGNIVPYTPTQDTTINLATVPVQEFTLVIVTSGTSSFTITFGTGFKTTGTLATGTVSGKVFTIRFVCDGTRCAEVSRTAAM
jgi:hypothetical protein